MIQSITIKDTASYNSTGILISELRKVNFIYGANGSGKTTISNFLNDAEDPRFPECELKWVADEKIDTLVYNKEFRDRNFGKGVVDGVFTLGEATKEQIEEIDLLKAERDGIKTIIIETRESLEGLRVGIEEDRSDFKEYVWKSLFKKHEREFREAFRGIALNKEPFMNELINQFKNNKSKLYKKDELVQRAKTLLGTVPVQITNIPVPEIKPFIDLEKNPIWNKRIVGKTDIDIAKLIQQLGISDWVNEGKNYIQEGADICPFCQKDTIDEKFREQLDNFFDKEFLNNTKELKEVSDNYIQLSSLIVESLKEIEQTQIEEGNDVIDLKRFTPLFKSIEVQIAGVSKVIESKIKEPSRSVALPSVSEPLETICILISEANEKIEAHNKMVLNYQDEKKKLINDIWKFYIEEEKSKIDSHLKKISGLSSVLKKHESNIKIQKDKYLALDKKIKELNKNVTSVQPTVDEINRLLRFYGFTNFEIVPSKSDVNQYQILREDGTLAEDTLSEGEITFITLLYFLQRIKGGLSEETVGNDRVVVIDDPISSLDSSVLFIISSLIKQIIKKVKIGDGNIKQILLLTHNVYFHKEVSYEGARAKGERPFFWILRKKNSITGIQCYEENNPIHSSYELLWNELRNWENSSGITIQNVMRRILENYFSILGSKRDDTLISSFATYEEQEICRSLLSWTNEGSHTLPDDLLIEIPDDTIVNYLRVFKRIFEKTQNLGHYLMMMKEEVED